MEVMDIMYTVAIGLSRTIFTLTRPFTETQGDDLAVNHSNDGF